MTNCSRITVNLPVIATLVRLVAEEVDSRIFHSTGFFRLVLQMIQTIRLIPARRKDIERDLATN